MIEPWKQVLTAKELKIVNNPLADIKDVQRIYKQTQYRNAAK